MIRIATAVFFVSLLIVTAISLQGDPGAASLTWLGWRVDTTAAAGVLIIGLLALAATVFWRTLLWIVDAPSRAARLRADSRRRQGTEVLTRGFLEAAAGNGPEARRLAQRASDLSQETPQLVRLLAAQAADAAGDRAAAESAYQAMLGFPEMRLAAYRGLAQAAVTAGDPAEALIQADAAYNLPHTAPWAWRMLFKARLDEADWQGAMGLVQGAQERKIVSPLIAGRARAALQTAIAADLEARGAAGEALEFGSGRRQGAAGFHPGRRAGRPTARPRGPHGARRLSAGIGVGGEAPPGRVAGVARPAHRRDAEGAGRAPGPTGQHAGRFARGQDRDGRTGVDRGRCGGRQAGRRGTRRRARDPAPGRAPMARVANADGDARRGQSLDRPGRRGAGGAGLVGYRSLGKGLSVRPGRLGADDPRLCRQRRTHPPAP